MDLEWMWALTKKLPTLKGITAFFYVATHWGTISEDLERYRKQIEDERQWRQASEEAIRKLFELEMETVKAEANNQVMAIEQKANVLERQVFDLLDALIHACTFIAFEAQSSPLKWALVKNGYPSSRHTVRR